MTALVLALGSYGWGCAPPPDPVVPDVVPLSRPSSLASQPIPKTLDEALNALERGGSGRFHAGMRTDDETTALSVDYDIRWDPWGLGHDSPLQIHMESLGFRTPWEMREVILRTYWRRLHRRPLDIESLVKASNERLAKQQQMAAAMAEREKQHTARMRSMMMGLALVPASRPSISVEERASDGLRARYLAAFRDGVLIGVRKYPDNDALRPYFYTAIGGIRPVNIRGVDDVRSFVVASDGLWVAGVTAERPILLKVGRTRERLDFPRQELAQLGIDDQQRPIAIYSDAVFRWTEARWTLARAAMKLPKTVVPPRLLNSTLLLRGEGAGENGKQLFWTDIDRDAPLITHDKAIGLGMFDALSYLSTRTGEFWFTTGNSAFSGWTLVRRSSDGQYRLAVLSGQLAVVENYDTPVVNISAVAELADGQLVGAGNLGFYRIETDRIVTLARFRSAHDDQDWDPTDILELSPQRYLISGLFGGIYLLDLRGDKYRMVELDERIGPSIEL